MRVGDYCTREVVAADGSTGVSEAARLMRREHVGTIVVVDGSSGAARPTGIVTDRDLVLEVLAAEARPDALTLSDLQIAHLVVAREDDDLMTTLERMRGLGIRRVPVVDGNGALQGLLAMDDVLPVVSQMLNNVVQLIARQVTQEVHNRP